MSRPLPVPLRLLVVLGLLSALTPFAIDTYLPSIPRIARDLDAGIALALVRDLFERDTYARVMGLVMLIMGMAPLSAPSIGGLIVIDLRFHTPSRVRQSVSQVTVLRLYCVIITHKEHRESTGKPSISRFIIG